MNQEMLTSLVRTILQTSGAGLITHGWVNTTDWTQICSGLAVVIVTTGWALYTRRDNGLIASAAALPKVTQIKADSATETAIPSPKVVAS